MPLASPRKISSIALSNYDRLSKGNLEQRTIEWTMRKEYTRYTKMYINNNIITSTFRNILRGRCVSCFFLSGFLTGFLSSFSVTVVLLKYCVSTIWNKSSYLSYPASRTVKLFKVQWWNWQYKTLRLLSCVCPASSTASITASVAASTTSLICWREYARVKQAMPFNDHVMTIPALTFHARSNYLFLDPWP